jgi:hypothetical protein
VWGQGMSKTIVMACCVLGLLLLGCISCQPNNTTILGSDVPPITLTPTVIPNEQDKDLYNKVSALQINIDELNASIRTIQLQIMGINSNLRQTPNTRNMDYEERLLNTEEELGEIEGKLTNLLNMDNDLLNQINTRAEGKLDKDVFQQQINNEISMIAVLQGKVSSLESQYNNINNMNQNMYKMQQDIADLRARIYILEHKPVEIE